MGWNVLSSPWAGFAGVAAAIAVLGVVLWRMPTATRRQRFSRAVLWFSHNYWAVMVIGGLTLGLLAIHVYLFDVGRSVGHLVDRLLGAAASPFTPAADLRNIATATAVLLGAMAAAATLIFQLVRVWTTERATRATEEGLVTERINKAVENLGAMRTVRRPRLDEDGTQLCQRGADGSPDPALPVYDEITEPNIEVRIGGILALERISQDSARDHIQVMEILCAYIRENAPADGVKTAEEEIGQKPDRDKPESYVEFESYSKALDDWLDKLSLWVEARPAPRTDIQTALSVIGRRDARRIALERAHRSPGRPQGYIIDLRHTNLRRADLRGLQFDRALFAGARMERANLSGAQMQGTDLWESRMAGADLSGAQMEGAILSEAQMEWADLCAAWMARADLSGVQMEGADLSTAQMEQADLTAARMERADLREAQMLGADLRGAGMERANPHGARMAVADLSGARIENTPFLNTAKTLDGAVLKENDISNIPFTADQLKAVFGDGSVILGDHDRPSHWPAAELHPRDYDKEYRDWLSNPASYKPPQDRS